MNNYSQRFIVGTLADAYAYGCDTVQLKHVGAPVTIIATEDSVEVNFRDVLEDVRHSTLTSDAPINGVFLGVHARDGRFLVYDCVELDGVDQRGESYRVRSLRTRNNVRRLGPQFTIVPSFPILHSGLLWRTQVVPNELNGLVFRKSSDDFRGDVYIMRHYREAPMAFPEDSVGTGTSPVAPPATAASPVAAPVDPPSSPARTTPASEQAAVPAKVVPTASASVESTSPTDED